MPKKKRNAKISRTWLGAKRGIHGFLGNKKAVSVVLSTVVLSAGVLALGIAVMYWAFSMGHIANLQYSKTVATNSYAVAERVGFEYISYSKSNNMLTVNLINCGAANNLNISTVHITDNSHKPVGTGAYTPSSLTNITTGEQIPENSLDIGEEGKFTITFSSPLPDGFYNIRIVTGRGRNFDTSFIAA